eukprot:COSAG02_NODE_5077_length_4659_cov_29.565570_2_plen_612_part_00
MVRGPNRTAKVAKAGFRCRGQLVHIAMAPKKKKRKRTQITVEEIDGSPALDSRGRSLPTSPSSSPRGYTDAEQPSLLLPSTEKSAVQLLPTQSLFDSVHQRSGRSSSSRRAPACTLLVERGELRVWLTSNAQLTSAERRDLAAQLDSTVPELWQQAIPVQLESRGSFTLSLCNSELIVAVAMVDCNRQDDAAVIRMQATHPAYRKRGCGRLLNALLHSECQRLGVRLICVEVHKENISGYWNKLGYDVPQPGRLQLPGAIAPRFKNTVFLITATLPHELRKFPNFDVVPELHVNDDNDDDDDDSASDSNQDSDSGSSSDDYGDYEPAHQRASGRAQRSTQPAHQPAAAKPAAKPATSVHHGSLWTLQELEVVESAIKKHKQSKVKISQRSSKQQLEQHLPNRSFGAIHGQWHYLFNGMSAQQRFKNISKGARTSQWGDGTSQTQKAITLRRQRKGLSQEYLSMDDVLSLKRTDSNFDEVSTKFGQHREANVLRAGDQSHGLPCITLQTQNQFVEKYYVRHAELQFDLVAKQAFEATQPFPFVLDSAQMGHTSLVFRIFPQCRDDQQLLEKVLEFREKGYEPLRTGGTEPIRANRISLLRLDPYLSVCSSQH